MPDACCVPGCNDRSGGHRFPKETEPRQRWIVAVKRLDPVTGDLWQPKKHSVVCKQHFTQDDYTETLMGERKRLKPVTVPKLKAIECEKTSRSERAHRRDHELNVAPLKEIPKTEVDTEEPDIYILDDSHDIVEETINLDSDLNIPQGDISSAMISHTHSSICTQTSPHKPEISSHRLQSTTTQTPVFPFLSIFNFQHKPKLIKYYTGFDDYQHFMFFFHILGPASSHLGITDQIQPQEQLFITLVKLRQGKDDLELELLCNTRRAVISKIFYTWINFLYFQLKEINIWPTRQAIDEHFPNSFKSKFPTTLVILDATEVPIQKPRQVCPQRETFSTYKNRNTLKVMVGCTPKGGISYISDSYGGSCSDRQIIEWSTLLSNPELFKNSIMADRGIMVQDLFANKNVFVNTPHMLKGKSQLEPEEVQYDRKVASKRIHVE